MKTTADHRDVLSALLHSIQSIDKLHSIRDVARANEIIAEMILHLPGPVTPQQLCRIDSDANVNWIQVARNEYAHILCELIRLFDSEWPVNINNGDPNQWTINQNVFNLFSIDFSFDFVHVSLLHIFAKSNASKRSALIKIFESCMRNEKWLVAAFIDVCFVEHSTKMPLSYDQDQFIQLLVAAPNRIANHFNGKHSTIFEPESFSNVLLLALIQACSFIVTINQKTDERKWFCSKFLGQLLGRIAVDFHCNRTSEALPTAFQVLSLLMDECDAFKAFVHEMCMNLPRTSLNIGIWYILNMDNPNEFLCDAVNESSDWNFLLTKKLPMQSNALDDKRMKNLVKYLSTKLSAKECADMLQNVLMAWSTNISISMNSIEQQFHLSKLIVLAIAVFNLERTNELIEIVHNGTRNHMKELDQTIRAIGMITAEIALNALSPLENEESKLKFDYDGCTDEAKTIISEIRAMYEQANESAPKNGDDIDVVISKLYTVYNQNECRIDSNVFAPTKNIIENTSIEIGSLSASTKRADAIVANVCSEIESDILDSDDDDDNLQTYDMSNDRPLIEEKRPRYLNDLRDTLLDTDDPEIFEQCMICSTELINEKLPNDITAIGLKLLQMFIDLEKRFYMENFEMLRNSACVAICCIQPKVCAAYLCNEFHAEIGRFTIARKVLLLEILAETAKTLSMLNNKEDKSTQENRVPTKRMRKLIDESDNHVKRLDEIKRTISVRIAQKTRQFAHRTDDTFKNAKRNRFAEVAGDFMFPLLYGFGKEQLTLYGIKNTLKDDTDNILLMIFLNAVSTITLASQNCPIITKIIPEVFQLALILRFHTEPKIRLAVLQMIASILIAAPKYLLQTHFLNYVQETHQWLQECLSYNIIKNEKNIECRALANKVMALCIETLST